jgi:hypothetical protein
MTAWIHEENEIALLISVYDMLQYDWQGRCWKCIVPTTARMEFWVSRRRWVGCSSYDLRPRRFRRMSFLFGLTRVSCVHHSITILWTSEGMLPARSFLRGIENRKEASVPMLRRRSTAATKFPLRIPRIVWNLLIFASISETTASIMARFLANLPEEWGTLTRCSSKRMFYRMVCCTCASHGLG